MGNNIVGGRKKAKVMKISGESFKLKTPTKACEVTKSYPGHVLLESESVKKYGLRAKPLELQEDLQPNKIYFLVELPKFPEQRVPRRTRSDVQMSAKDRLESLKLRRSASEISVTSPSSGQPLQVKMKLPRSQVQKLIEEGKDDAELAEKIIGLCLQNSNVKGEGTAGSKVPSNCTVSS